MEFIDLKSQYDALRAQINARIQTVLDHGQYILGPEVIELEQRLTEYTGARHCVTVASGTEALLIALMAIGIKPGDEVITTAFSFVATAEVIALLGATPVFVDIEPDTCNINPACIEEKITPHTRAIIPVSLYGQPADMDEINAIAERFGLTVIEDAAQSFGATYKGRKSCNLSTIACTSFFPSKPLGCYGDGGALFTSNEALAQSMREIRVHGQSKRYVHSRLGVGGRMDTLQCAIVLAKLERFGWEVQQRQELASLYRDLLDGYVEPTSCRSDRTSVYAQYTIAVDNRATLQAKLLEMGIPTAVHYPLPIPLQPAYLQYCREDELPVSLAMSKRVISLPMGPYMGHDDVRQVCNAVRTAVGHNTIHLGAVPVTTA
ncbi:DegT/DnrJ/EryC1/StrS family aminotransferase [Noviherbaspirillum saxi]|uniref:DegT/DnrJ/EryC1/StrS family aminotransferase n=1 Tax=Noviherbaspirillum saxi TaxID=2320863 RepID=A0A3A3FR06_9BURK|nr:DegT/DnrJ/EryC1/StrS family aminotransferase [Noviherbaspirillum saxi]RJF95882.1 DegT/DnrJ/EryC1/StrS family aminotransferase [Noviherbaspirillum saxi]